MLKILAKSKASKIDSRGVFALQEISKGTHIHSMKKNEFPKYKINEIKKWGINKIRKFLHFAYQGGRNFYYGFNKDISFLMNHSCDPNCWYIDDYTIAARKDIKSGEELTLDYATLMSPNGFEEPFKCKCRSKICRKFISKSDCLLPEIKKRYKGHFLKYLSAIQDKSEN